MSISYTTQPAFTRGRLRFLRPVLFGMGKRPVSNPGKLKAKSRLKSNPYHLGELAQSSVKPEAKPGTKSKNQPQKSFAHQIWQHFLSLVIVGSAIALAVLLAPDVYYKFSPPDTQPIQAWAASSVLGGLFEKGSESEAAVQEQAAEETVNPYLPPKNENLPEGTWLIIPRIGVRTEIKPGQSPEEALAEGVWLAPDYGQIGDLTQPVIMAAHRYGWKWWWRDDYWEYHSFYNLPKTEPGDIIEVIDDQRKWVYEIYAGAEGEEIEDYQADMVLYTCKFLNSPIRHFRYARLIDSQRDSQI